MTASEAQHSRERGEGARLAPRRAAATVLRWSEYAVYLSIAVFLVVAAGVTIAATGDVLISSIDDGNSLVETGLLTLDRVLLVFIVAELIYTVQLVIRGEEFPVEAFLFIGLIAVVRRVLVITAELERAAGEALTNFLIEIGLLGVLALAFATAIYLVRRSERERTRRGA